MSSMMSSSSSLPLTTGVVSIANAANSSLQPKEYLCLFHLMTSGLLEENLGSDEEEILEMIYLIMDVQAKEVSQCSFLFSS